jgi:putative flippase GtrA
MDPFKVVVGPAGRLSQRIPQGLVRFLSVGMVGLATHTGVFTLLYRLGVAKSPAWFAGLALGTLVTWQLNRRLTFTASGRRRRAEVTRYALVTAVAQGVSFGVFHAVGAFAPAVPAPIALMIGAAIATLFSYSGQRFFTFAPPRSPISVAPVEVDPTPEIAAG